MLKGKGKESILVKYLPCAKIWARPSTYASSFNPHLSAKNILCPLWCKWGALHSEIRELTALMQMRLWELAYRKREVGLQNPYYSLSTKSHTTKASQTMSLASSKLPWITVFSESLRRLLSSPIILSSVKPSSYPNSTSVLLLCEHFSQ